MTSAEEAYCQGGIIAYPTEAVFGLGCDPDNLPAIEKLLNIKSRSPEKGLNWLQIIHSFYLILMIVKYHKINVLVCYLAGQTVLLS